MNKKIVKPIVIREMSEEEMKASNEFHKSASFFDEDIMVNPSLIEQGASEYLAKSYSYVQPEFRKMIYEHWKAAIQWLQTSAGTREGDYTQEDVLKILQDSFDWAVEQVYGKDDNLRNAAKNWASGFHGNLPRREADILAFNAGAKYFVEIPRKNTERLTREAELEKCLGEYFSVTRFTSEDWKEWEAKAKSLLDPYKEKPSIAGDLYGGA